MGVQCWDVGTEAATFPGQSLPHTTGKGMPAAPAPLQSSEEKHNPCLQPRAGSAGKITPILTPLRSTE